MAVRTLSKDSRHDTVGERSHKRLGGSEQKRGARLWKSLAWVRSTRGLRPSIVLGVLACDFG